MIGGFAKAKGRTMIRPATPADIPGLLAFGVKFHAASQMPMQFDQSAMGDVLAGMIESDRAAVLMTDAGVIGGILSPAYCDPAWVMAVELFWWAERDGLALLRAFEDWAQQAGAQEVRMTSLASLPRADAILKRKGYAPIEISYQKVM